MCKQNAFFLYFVIFWCQHIILFLMLVKTQNVIFIHKNKKKYWLYKKNSTSFHIHTTIISCWKMCKQLLFVNGLSLLLKFSEFVIWQEWVQLSNYFKRENNPQLGLHSLIRLFQRNWSALHVCCCCCCYHGNPSQ